MNDVKNFTPIDLPLLRRLAARGLSLDTVALVRDANPLETAMLGAVGLTGRGRPTYILRDEEGEFAAQIYLEGNQARISLLAPTPRPEHSFTPWLALIEHLLVQAGRRGAHLVTAEAPLEGTTLELFRHAGFTIYSRQTLYYLDRGKTTKLREAYHDRLQVRPLQEQDQPKLKALHANTVPRLVQQADFSARQDCQGLALLLNGVLRGYISVWEGKGGVLLQPYLHPELYDLVEEAFTLALGQLPKRRTYVRLLAYQAWLHQALSTELGFVEWSQSALMARQIVVQVQAALPAPLPALEAIGLGANVEVALGSSLEPREHTYRDIKQLTEWDTE